MTRDIIKKIIYFIKQNKSFAMVTILNHYGSTPRVSGTTMIVSYDGDCYGTIGGGILEADIIKVAVNSIKKKITEIVRFDLTSKEIIYGGMVCGGKLSVMIDPILLEEDLVDIFDYCLKAINCGEKGIFITLYDKYCPSNTGHYFTNNLNKIYNILLLNKDEIYKIEQSKIKNDNFGVIELEKKILIFSPVCIPEKVYIFGGGHVAQPTALIASIVGFDVIVMDDRMAFADKARFPSASKVMVVNFNNVAKYISDKSYVIIITRGHIYDEIVLRQAMETNAIYIGMIGSIKKRSKIFNLLMEDGVCKKNIKKLFSPIGIDISSETPEEIALSIVAEMILIRSKHSR